MKNKLLIFSLILFLLLSTITVTYNITHDEDLFFYLFATTKDKLKKVGYTDEEIEKIIALSDENIYYLKKNEYKKNILDYLNDENYKDENLKAYFKDSNEISINNKIKLVNHKDYDENYTYTNIMVDILYDKFYISKNKDRYFKQEDKSARTIVEKINTNRDYDYYTNTKESDLKKEILMIANKYYTIGKYEPKVVTLSAKYGNTNIKITEETKNAFIKMFNDAKKDGYTLYVTSGYRSYKEQQEVFNEYVNSVGEKEALKYAAKPGFSEHQTGLSMDIFTPGSTTKTFKNTNTSKWLENNAYKYGFILRYPEGKEDITGYNYEAWHYRYVGEKVAQQIHQLNITYDEYYEYFN